MPFGYQAADAVTTPFSPLRAISIEGADEVM